MYSRQYMSHMFARRPNDLRTFAVVTTRANELVSEIYNRMPVILPPEAYEG